MDGVSVAASLVGIGAVGGQIAIKLYTLAAQISTASDRISSISNDVSLTSSVLQQLGELMNQKAANGGISIFSQSGLETTKTSATMCENIFKTIEQAARDASEQIRGRGRGRIVGKINLSKSEKAKWPFLQPSIEALRDDLRMAKGTLMLMLQVTTLAFSKKMADDRESLSSYIVEQRDIIHAFLELSKQEQAKEKSGSRAISISSSSNGSPKRDCSRILTRQTSWPNEESTLVTSLTPRSSSSLPIRPNILVTMPGQGLPNREIPEHSEKPSINKGPRNTGSGSGLRNVRQDDYNNAVDCNYSTCTPTDAMDDGYGKGAKYLDLFLLKPVIRDIVDVIQLSWKIHQAQMKQVEVQKHIIKIEKEGHQAVFESYHELHSHEHIAIDSEIAKAGVGASLVSLKRTTSNLWHRDIYFKGVPGLQFVVERVAQRPSFPQAAQYPVHGSAKSLPSPPEQPGERDQNRKQALAYMINDTDLGSWADEMDDSPAISQGLVTDVSNDKGSEDKPGRKKRSLSQPPIHVDTAPYTAEAPPSQPAIHVHTASNAADEERKRNAGGFRRFRQRVKEGKKREPKGQLQSSTPLTLHKAIGNPDPGTQDWSRPQPYAVADTLEGETGSAVKKGDTSKSEVIYMYDDQYSEAQSEDDQDHPSGATHRISTPTQRRELNYLEAKSDLHQTLDTPFRSWSLVNAQSDQRPYDAGAVKGLDQKTFEHFSNGQIKMRNESSPPPQWMPPPRWIYGDDQRFVTSSKGADDFAGKMDDGEDGKEDEMEVDMEVMGTDETIEEDEIVVEQEVMDNDENIEEDEKEAKEDVIDYDRDIEEDEKKTEEEAIDNDENSEEDEEELMEEVMDEEEAERVVRELLGKYTTLFSNQTDAVKEGVY